jgi:hypothetical protein
MYCKNLLICHGISDWLTFEMFPAPGKQLDYIFLLVDKLKMAGLAMLAFQIVTYCFLIF